MCHDQYSQLFFYSKELTKLENEASPKEGGLINWLMFLKGADKSKWEALQMNEPTLKKAMDTLEFLSQDQETRRLYKEMDVIVQASGLSEAEVESLKPAK
jgi:hypothetical protein